MTEYELSSFGALLKALRTRRHLTQQQLAEAIGVHRNAIIRWEQGDFLPAQKSIVLELARQLHLDQQESRQLLEASLTALAPYWLVPLPRNPFFTGREAALERLHALLCSGQVTAITHSSALQGLGGVGKTQIALEYAYRHALDYSAVFWIGAESEEQVIASLLRIAEVLQLPGRDEQDQQRTLAAVQRWLGSHDQWLLIWDNVEELALLDRFLPVARSGAILITTRCQAVGTHAQGLDLLPMEHEEGMLFLLRRAKLLAPEATGAQLRHVARSASAEYAAAEKLVIALGGLPLALDQAGAYIEETGCGLSGYVQRSNQHLPHLLDHRGSASGTGHPQSVSVTFRLAYERIEREQQAAAQILQACAFLHPDAIPEELFAEGAAHLGPELEQLAGQPTQFDQAVASLLRLSLVQRHPETRTLSLHRLVQAVLRESLEPPAADQWCARVMRALNAAFPELALTHHTQHWPQCERYLLHAQMSLQLVKQTGERMPEARELFAKAGSYLLERGRYAEAEEFLTQATMPGEQQEGNDPLAAQTLDRLATLYWRQTEYQQAEHLFQRTLAISEERLGANDPSVATYLENLSLLYYEQGKYQQAETALQRAIIIYEYHLDSLSPEFALYYDNMARILEAQGEHGQAEQLYRRALATWENLPGPPQPDMTFCLNNLGIFYIKQQRYDLAEPLLQRALALRQQLLGPDHPRTATSLYSLARLAQKQGKVEEATQLAEQALHILEQQAGQERSTLARVLENLGVLYQAQGKDEQAEAFFLRALAMQEQYLGSCHPATANTLYDLARFRQQQGKLNEALTFAQRAFTIHTQILGSAHSDTIATQTLYAQLCQEQAGMQPGEDSQRRAEEVIRPYEEEHHTNGTMLPLHETDDPAYSENEALQEFLSACCELHPLACCRVSDLWHAYERWSALHQQQFSLSRRAFAAQLKAHGCRADRTSKARIWRGIRIVEM